MSPLKRGLLVFISILLIALSFWILVSRVRESAQTTSSNPYLKMTDFEHEGVPDFTATDTSGHTYKLSQWKGKVVLLSFWATWCAPCVEEFPSLMRMLDQFPNDIVMVGVSADQSKKDIDDFITMFGGKQKNNFFSLWDPSLQIASTYGTEQIPENYIIDRNMKLIKKFSNSENWTSPDMLAYLKQLVSKTASKN